MFDLLSNIISYSEQIIDEQTRLHLGWKQYKSVVSKNMTLLKKKSFGISTLKYKFVSDTNKTFSLRRAYSMAIGFSSEPGEKNNFSLLLNWILKHRIFTFPPVSGIN